MPGILIYSENMVIARELITAGLSLKQEMNEPVGVITISSEGHAELIAAGADQVFFLKGDVKWPEGYADAIAGLAGKQGANVLIIGGTLRGKNVAARVAAQLKAGLVTDAQSISFKAGKLATTRLKYGGLAVAAEAVALPALVTIPPRTYEQSALAEGKNGDIHSIEVSMDKKVAISNVCPSARQGGDISVAARIVCVGRGMGKKEDLAMIEELAEAVGGEIGCTRGVAEDYHWLPAERYIGISGQKVKPELYLSLGVSGQVQHVAGMRDAKLIVAIDSNEKAPIFAAADYGIVGDMYEVVPLLIKALKK